MTTTGSPVAVLVETDITPSSYATVAPRARTPQEPLSTAGCVRRPTRGIQLKKPVFATITVVGADVAIKNSSAPVGSQVSFTSNFLLQSVQESRQEKFQPVPTFGAPYGFFFGEQPRMISCQAMLLNTADFQWDLEWWANYDQYFRGTRLVDRGARVQLSYEDSTIEGYLVTASTAKSEPTPWATSLSFTLWVTRSYVEILVGGHSIDEFHTHDVATEWDALDASQEGSGSMTEQAIARNAKMLSESSGTGLIQAIQQSQSGLESFVGRVGATLRGAVDWLYGRNMVIPQGFAGADRYAGSLRAGAAGLTIHAPIRMKALTPAKGNFYDDNPDEYPMRGSAAPFWPQAEQNMPTKDPVVTFAEEMFRKFGINVTSDKGQQSNKLMRTVGKAAFAIESYSASVLSTQVRSLLTENADKTAWIASFAEQGTAEALQTLRMS